MAKWLNTLDISEGYKAAGKNHSQIPALAAAIARKLSNLLALHHPDTCDLMTLEQIKADFNQLFRDDNQDVEDFDNIMEMLYDWADENHNCWIKTF